MAPCPRLGRAPLPQSLDRGLLYRLFRSASKDSFRNAGAGDMGFDHTMAGIEAVVAKCAEACDADRLMLGRLRSYVATLESWAFVKGMQAAEFEQKRMYSGIQPGDLPPSIAEEYANEQREEVST